MPPSSLLIRTLRWLTIGLAFSALAAFAFHHLNASAQALPAQPQAASWPQELERRTDVFEDKGGQLTLAQVREQPASQWKSLGGEAANFALSHSAWWLRFELDNPSAHTARRVLEVPNPLVDYLDVHVVDIATGALREEFHTGDRRPFASRPIPHTGFAFPIELPPQSRVQVMVRLGTYDGLHEAAPLRLWDERSFTGHLESSGWAHGLYYGALFALLLYNLVLFASTRDGLYAQYGLYLMGFLLWNATLRGVAFRYVWPEQSWWTNQVLLLGALAAYAGLVAFSARFMNFREAAPRANRFMRGLLIGLALCGIPALMGKHQLSVFFILPIGLVTLLSVSGVGMRLAWGGSRAARLWLLAWMSLISCLPLHLARIAGLVPASFLSENGFQIGSALEFILLAFALADRMNQLKADKLAAERSAREVQTLANQRLEGQVRERTQALEVANRRLTEMSITDELTGAFNRRHFNESIGEELKRRHRPGVLALALIDVDHFKAYNDRYGHPQGDRALQAVSTVARGLLRRSSDRFFRVGGEEFALLIEASHEGNAIDFMDMLRETVARLRMPHEGSAHGHVSVSVGVVVLSPDAPPIEPNALYARADALLYEAKAGGRNRIRSEVLQAEPA